MRCRGGCKSVVAERCRRGLYCMSEMCEMEALKIDLNGLKEGVTQLSYSLDDAYFESVGGSDTKSGKVDVAVSVSRAADFFELSFRFVGTVIVPCDICLDDMEQRVSGENRLTARLGEAYSEDDDLITVERDDAVLDLSWFIYEFIALSIPIKHVHEEGKCNPDMLKTLAEYSADRGGEGCEEAAIDPRWSELEKLKTIIKD